MRQTNRPAGNEPSDRGAATIRLSDYRTEPQTRVSWNEIQIHREEIRLPRGARPSGQLG